jgi:hypothetical protein
MPVDGTTVLLALWVVGFLGGLLIGLGLRGGEPPRWWERPWPTGPAPEPSFGERTRSGRQA